MAKKAGYSATTLSEAAGGVRRPSLDVTLAYVGSCGGDLDTWRLRWYDLAAAPAAPDAQATQAPSDDPPASPPSPPAPPARRMARARWPRRPAARWAVAAVAVALTAAAAVVIGSRVVTSGEPAAEGCPAAHPAAVFTGQTYVFTRVRSAPALSAPVLQTIPAECDVGFTGFCLGDTVIDQTAGTPDIRWFTLPGGGVVASAIIHGNPPDALAPAECAGGRAAPETINLDVADAPADGPGLRLRATGVGVRIVGFAALYADTTNEMRWHQIGFTGSAAPRFDLLWDPGLLPPQPRPGEGVTVAAVACLGGDGPTRVADAKVVRPDAGQAVTTPRLPRETLDAATRAACHYPDNAAPTPSARPGSAGRPNALPLSLAAG